MRAMFPNKATMKLLVYLEGILYSAADVGAAIYILNVDVLFSLHCSGRPELQHSQHTLIQRVHEFSARSQPRRSPSML